MIKLLVLFGCFWLYLALGAVVFPLFESENERLASEEFEELIADFLAAYPCMDESEVLEIQQAVNNAYNEGGLAITSVIYNTSGESYWDYKNSLVFVSTIATTIGYGHIAPRTNVGRSMCIVFGVIGVPLLMMIALRCGNLCTDAIKKLHTLSIDTWKKFFHSYHSFITYLSQFCIGASIVVVLLLLPALYYSISMTWTYLDSVYAIFITASTIGFGDFPLANSCSRSMMVCHIMLTAVNLTLSIINLSILGEVFKYTIRKEEMAAKYIQRIAHKRRRPVSQQNSSLRVLETT